MDLYRSAADLYRALEPESVQLIWTDPPWKYRTLLEMR